MDIHELAGCIKVCDTYIALNQKRIERAKAGFLLREGLPEVPLHPTLVSAYTKRCKETIKRLKGDRVFYLAQLHEMQDWAIRNILRFGI